MIPGVKVSAGHILSNEPTKVSNSREAAINHPVQGSAADIMKMVMINVHCAIQQSGYQGKMTLQVHDELVLECLASELEGLSAFVKKEMEEAYQISVKQRADVVTGRNWDEVE